MTKEAYRCDLHIHSVYSDGSDTPREICQKALAAGVEVISITDHDGLGNTEEKIREAKAFNLLYITGLELSAYEKDKQVHILGYGVDAQNEEFLNTLKRLDNNRLERTYIMLKRLKTFYGIEIDIEEIKQTGTQSVGSMHIARTLVAKGRAKDISAAFNNFIGYGCKAYCPEIRQSAQEAVQTINLAGGKAVLAHPGKLKTDPERMLEKLASSGLFGIEAIYSSHNNEQTEYFKKLAGKYGLFVTAGSDYHGSGRKETIGYPYAQLSADLLKTFKIG